MADLTFAERIDHFNDEREELDMLLDDALMKLMKAHGDDPYGENIHEFYVTTEGHLRLTSSGTDYNMPKTYTIPYPWVEKLGDGGVAALGPLFEEIKEQTAKKNADDKAAAEQREVERLEGRLRVLRGETK